jgi:hypothetical protein
VSFDMTNKIIQHVAEENSDRNPENPENPV